DEPTHNLDRQSVHELAQTLKHHLPKIVDQIFIITHDTHMQEAATQKSFVLSRNKELFESTRIEENEISWSAD
ncbi:MAG: hypothetical protein HY917_00685, partial [Candidatus Diapherotrites archaeon]|nr:hypothetical protein [Candidatus Diapherotrites archaeon]